MTWAVVEVTQSGQRVAINLDHVKKMVEHGDQTGLWFDDGHGPLVVNEDMTTLLAKTY